MNVLSGYYTGMAYVAAGLAIFAALKIWSDFKVSSKALTITFGNDVPARPHVTGPDELADALDNARISQNSVCAVKHLPLLITDVRVSLSKMLGVKAGSLYVNDNIRDVFSKSGSPSTYCYNNIVLSSENPQNEVASRLVYEKILNDGDYKLPACRDAEHLLLSNNILCFADLQSGVLVAASRRKCTITVFVPEALIPNFKETCKVHARWNGFMLMLYLSGRLKVITC